MWRSIGSPTVSGLSSLPILTLVSLFALSVTEAGQREQTQASDESTGLRVAAAWMYDPPPIPPPIEQAAPTTPPSLKRLRITVTKRRPVPAPKQLYCVRLCDGFYFPMTTLATASASREAGLCNALCPDAKTAVYTLSTAEDGINAATTRIGGKVYNALATAFAYRRGISPHCACHQPGYPKLALSLDLTLKAGDIVVTDKGVRQFRGSRSFPYAERDFTAYGSGMSSATLRYLDTIDRPYQSKRVASEQHKKNSEHLEKGVELPERLKGSAD
jgi:hypothetical protein